MSDEIMMDNKMSVIITMAGLGSRFKKEGYKIPKYMIKAKGKTLFEWSMDSLIDYNSYVLNYVFVVRKTDRSTEFIKQQCLKYGIQNLNIVEIDYLTDGQATTVMQAIPYCNPENPIMIYNIDTYVEPYELKYSDIVGDGYIPCFCAEGTHWSFVKLDKDGKAVEVREKDRISDYCTLGAYYFSSAKLYSELYKDYVSDESIQNEKYIAPIYNYMIKKGMAVKISLVDSKKVHVLGTPEELKKFINP